MGNQFSINKYFRGYESSSGSILITTQLPFIYDSNVPYLIDALERIVDRNDKQILLDLSHTDNIDNISISLINKKIKHLASNGCFIKLLVTDQKPSMKYSIDDPVSISNEYLILTEETNNLHVN